MPNPSKTHVDRALTEISVGYFQDRSTYIADQVFPVVPVMKQSDRYFQYKKEDWFSDEAEERAMGTESAGGDYDIDNTPTYFCRKFSYHKDVFEEERANSDAPLTPDEDAVAFVVEKLLLRREVSWANTYFKSGVWGTDVTGVAATPTGSQILQWNDPNSSPIEDVAKYCTKMQETTGKRPNRLVIGQYVYDALKNHPDILDRIKYTQKGVVTLELLQSLLDIEKIVVAGALKNNAAKGQTASLGFIFGKGALLCHTVGRPSIKTPTAGYIFSWKGLMGANAYGGRILRIPVPLLGDGAERIEGEITWDMKVVASDLGTFITSAVA